MFSLPFLVLSKIILYPHVCVFTYIQMHMRENMHFFSFWKSQSVFLQISWFHFCLELNSILFHLCIRLSLSIHLLMDTQVGSVSLLYWVPCQLMNMGAQVSVVCVEFSVVCYFLSHVPFFGFKQCFYFFCLN